MGQVEDRAASVSVKVYGLLLRLSPSTINHIPSTIINHLSTSNKKAPDYSRALNVFVLYLTITKLVINRVQILTPS